ncbi:hypothetical protein B1A_14610, partial [mine drainage metagenome]
KRRSEKTLRMGLQALGPELVRGLRFVCSDMWKPYLNVLAAEASQALHVLDRFQCSEASCKSNGCESRPWKLSSCHGSYIQRQSRVTALAKA